MNDYVRRLVIMLESLIYNLEEKMRELDYKKEILEKVSRFVAYTNGDVHLVGIYADQELIMDNLANIDSDKEEYRACCYLLENDDENIQGLPQYKKAKTYINDLIEYFKKMKATLMEEIQNLEKECEKKRIENKYYEMFSKDNVYIIDIEEFENFLDEHDINIKDKAKLLLYVIKKNVEKYQEELKGISQ